MNTEHPQHRPADEPTFGESAPDDTTSQTPTPQAPTAPGSAAEAPTPHETAAQPPSAPEAAKGQPRSGPIFWGAIVLAICVYVAAQVFAPGSIDVTAFIIGSVIGLGVLLLAVGAAVLLRNRRGR